MVLVVNGDWSIYDDNDNDNENWIYKWWKWKCMSKTSNFYKKKIEKIKVITFSLIKGKWIF